MSKFFESFKKFWFFYFEIILLIIFPWLFPYAFHLPEAVMALGYPAEAILEGIEFGSGLAFEFVRWLSAIKFRTASTCVFWIERMRTSMHKIL